ncbi:anti-phage BREX system Lon protease BrxL [Ruminococcus sp.]
MGIPAQNTIGGDCMDELDRKVIAAFPGKSVRKDLTSLMKKGANVPTYVLEYLLGMYCATDDDEAIRAGLEKIKKILSENCVRPDQSDYVKSKIKENSRNSYMLLSDKLKNELAVGFYKTPLEAAKLALGVEPG